MVTVTLIGKYIKYFLFLGEVTLLAQAKEDGTFILVENSQQDTTKADNESAVETMQTNSLMQSSADYQNTISADTNIVKDGEIQPTKGNLFSECSFLFMNSKVYYNKFHGGNTIILNLIKFKFQ